MIGFSILMVVGAGLAVSCLLFLGFAIYEAVRTREWGLVGVLLVPLITMVAAVLYACGI